MGRRYSELSKVVEIGIALRNRCEDLEVAQEMFSDAEGDDREELRTEIDDAGRDIARLETGVPVAAPAAGPQRRTQRDHGDSREPRAVRRRTFSPATSSRCTSTYAATRGWNLEILNSQPSDMGGFSEITFRLAGDEVWPRMKFEAGPHRVQRVPVTESQGRVHTSSATVIVLPEAEEVDIDIDPGDLQIDTFRASGAGGQHVNKTESAIRVTHRPTGLMVSMQDEKSQLQNRIRAFAVLRSRLLQLEQEKADAQASAARKDQIGGGGRSEKVRTYNFKENRVTDHRIGLTIHQLDKVLAGDLSTFSDALVMDERTRQLAEAS